jgi:endonuclease/exonuclease/phosphatase (EEP) superfamily protein YafD
MIANSALITGLRLAMFCAAAALLAGFLGFLWQGFDAFAAFRMHLVIFIGLALLLTFRLRIPALRTAAGLLAMAAVVSVAPFSREDGRGPLDADWRLFQQNMMVGNERPADIAQYILDRKPEFVTLQEVSRAGLQVLEPLRQNYPVFLACPQDYGAGVVVLSRWKAVDGGVRGCDVIEKIGWVEVEGPKGRFVLVGVHMNWPWPTDYAGRQRRVQRILGELPRPMVIAGDFNMVPWAQSFRYLEARTGTRLVPPIRPSFRPGGLQALLPIDHVLIPQDKAARSELIPDLGSDHAGLWVRVGRLAPDPDR